MYCEKIRVTRLERADFFIGTSIEVPHDEDPKLLIADASADECYQHTPATSSVYLRSHEGDSGLDINLGRKTNSKLDVCSSLFLSGEEGRR